MRFFPNISIKRKLMLMAMLTSSVALLLSSAGFVVYELATFRENMRRDLYSEASLIGAQAAAPLSFDRPDEAAEILDALRIRKNIIAAGIYKENEIFATYPSTLTASDLPTKPVPAGFNFTADTLSLFQPIQSGGQTIGAVYLRSDLREMRSRLTRYAGIAGFMLAVSFVISFLISSRLRELISAPVLDLVNTARAVSADKNYSLRAAKHGADELGVLIDTFNEMLRQIQDRDAELQKVRDELEMKVQTRTQELQEEVFERLRAEKELQQQLSRIRLLNEIALAVAARQDFDSIVLVLLRELEDRLPIDYGTVYVYEEATGALIPAVRGPKSRGIAQQLQMPSRIEMKDTLFHRCLEDELVYLPDGLAENNPIAQKVARFGLRSAVAAPLKFENKVFGLLVLCRRDVDAFSIAERQFIRGLSAHVALAAHQARLYHDLQKAYDDVRQTQRAVMQQQRLQALGQMASGIAHDINNALSPVIAYADLLQMTEPNLSPNAKRILGLVKTSGEDIAHIVARMREFYRPRDAFEKFTELHLGQIAQEVVDLTRPRWRDMLQSRGTVIQMKVDFASNVPRVMGNASELREALTNLILNAVDALPNGGTIIVRTRVNSRLHSGSDANQCVIIEVADNGIGMEEETRRRCLEPFFSTKGKRGTGLGLAMVYGVMERHEGNIEIESAVNCGTLVRLTFPVRQSSGNAGDKVTGDAAAPALRILCVDDEPLIREVIKEVLEAEGHEVEVADGGQAGVNAFQKALDDDSAFDAVITDLGMPNLDGRQVARIIKQASSQTPVIMLTGWGTMLKDDGDVPVEVDGVLSKPPRIGELRDALAKIRPKQTRPQPPALLSEG